MQLVVLATSRTHHPRSNCVNKTPIALASTLWLSAALASAQAPGASGIGDPYFPDYGNGGYDVEHYDIRIHYEPTTDHVIGTTSILAKATQDLSSFNLDFALHVDSVLVNNEPAHFEQTGAHELVIEPSAALYAGDSLLVVVRYEDTPSEVKVGDIRTGWVRTADGANVLGEPEVAWWFFPSNDHPLDKATFDVSVLVPEDVEAISNGVLVSHYQTPSGLFEWKWHSSRPQHTYLAFLAIGQYELEESYTTSGMAVLNAYSSALGEDLAGARVSVGRTPEIIDWEESMFGPYPFEAIGGVVLPPDGEQGFALETQTRPVYAQGFFSGGADAYVVVHENAHQWYGDSVGVAKWSDVWLNEGFATYAEWLWSEREHEGTAQQIFDNFYEEFGDDEDFWSVVITDPGSRFDELFAWPIYARGAMALQQLRVTIGDDAFFELLPTWAAKKQYGNATTEELRELAEQISKLDLSGLFEAWLSTPTKPEAVQPSAAASGTTYSARPASWPKLRALIELKH
jgi:aminopeptidase N